MSEIVDHIIEAANPILGPARFLTLRLPQTWDISSGVGRPEIVASHQRGAIRWVANGQFWYVVYQQKEGWALEVNGRVSPGSGRQAKPSSETISISGHPANVHWRTRRRGLPWRRHDVTFMTVDYYCRSSDRRIKLEFSGWCPEAGFREVLKALNQTVCH